MKWALALALSALVAGPLCFAAPAKSKSHSAKKTAVASSARKSPSTSRAVAVTKNTATHTVTSRGRRVKGRHAVRAASGPTLQPHPDTERYQQIQQALAEKGYYKGEVTGQWNTDSVDALKRFQADKKLEPDGKINSWSLIDLGLGPKHDGSAVASTSMSQTSPPAARPSN